jgi:hypothetical protein
MKTACRDLESHHPVIDCFQPCTEICVSDLIAGNHTSPQTFQYRF